MKLAILTTLLLAGASPAVQAQRPWATNKAPLVRVTHVDASMAFAPGRVSILGENLQLVTAVRLGDTKVPVVSNDGQKMVIQLGPQDPGFDQLQLYVGDRPFGAPIEFLPSLKGHWRNPNRVTLSLHPGASGTYLLMYSFRRLPKANEYPGIYYCEWLDMNLFRSGSLFAGYVEGDEVLTFPEMRIPLWRIGYPNGILHVQALCASRESTCYSNVLSLAPTM